MDIYYAGGNAGYVGFYIYGASDGQTYADVLTNYCKLLAYYAKKRKLITKREEGEPNLQQCRNVVWLMAVRRKINLSGMTSQRLWSKLRSQYELSSATTLLRPG